MWHTNAGPVDVMSVMPAANDKLRDYGFMASTARAQEYRRLDLGRCAHHLSRLRVEPPSEDRESLQEFWQTLLINLVAQAWPSAPFSRTTST
jgi:hypothetical protein